MRSVATLGAVAIAIIGGAGVVALVSLAMACDSILGVAHPLYSDEVDDGAAGDDGTSDGAPSDGAAPVFADMSDPARWAFFDLPFQNCSGAAFDGRYVYSVCSPMSNVVVRIDVAQPFGLGAVAAADIATGSLSVLQFSGLLFDDSDVDFVPSTGGPLVRFGRHADFDAGPSYTAAGDIGGSGHGATIADGRFYVGLQDGYAQLALGTPMAAKFAGGPVFGTVYDGRFVYFVHATAQQIPDRFDTTAHVPFLDPEGWTHGPQLTDGFAGGVFDGRWVYFVPSTQGVDVPTLGAHAAAFDTKAPAPDSFGSAQAWKAFDVGQLGTNARGFRTGAFDGRFVYLVPFGDGTSDLLVRYDTTGVFDEPSWWKAQAIEDLSGAPQSAHGYGSAVFDGRYVYFLPRSTATIARFDAVPEGGHVDPVHNASFF
jgi:hypothetical protein